MKMTGVTLALFLTASFGSEGALAATPTPRGDADVDRSAMQTGASVANAASDGDEPGVADASARPETGSVEDIVVTAQRRSQDMQTVPIALSVITSDAASQLGFTSTEDLTAAVPGLAYSRSFASPAFYIRGVGQNDVNTGRETPVSVYVDGIYLATPAGALFSLSNIDRVEVLKGPQGTLFGRNATGGIVQVVTRDPSRDTRINASVGYGNFDTVTASFYGTTGLGENLAADLALYYSNQGDGWGKNIVTGADVYSSKEFTARSKLLWTPGDDTRVTLSGSYSNMKSDISNLIAVYPGSTAVFGLTNPGFYNVQVDTPRNSQYDIWTAALKVEQDLSFARLVSITSYQDLNEEAGFDSDASPQNFVYATKHAVGRTFTQEFQLMSPSSSSIDWIVGVYYLGQEIGILPITRGGTLFSSIPGFSTSTFTTQNTHSYSAFGDVTIPLGELSNFTAGIRYTSDHRKLQSMSINTLGVTTPEINQKKTWGSPSWRAVLDRQFTPDIFGYIQYSRGFKSGEYNATSAPAGAPVNPETIDNYEIGLKTKFADGRVRANLSVFRYDYDDKQLQRVIIGGTQLFNAASTRGKGFDLDGEIAATDNLKIRFGLAYLDAYFTSFPDSPLFSPNPAGGNVSSVGDVTGKKLPNSPEWQTSLGISYEIPSSIGTFTPSAQYSYNSGFYFAQSNRVKQPGYHMVNLSLGWDAPDRAWGLRAWVKNLADEKIVSYSSEQAFGDLYAPSAPRTFGIELRFRYGD